MLRRPQLAHELSRAQKILIARGAFLNSAQPQLEILVALAADPDAEISVLAQDTLTRLGNVQCAGLLADPSLPESVTRYFLNPSHVRPALLPALLANPSSPQDAITELAAKAGPDVLAMLLRHLELLKTPALAALQHNPAAPGRPQSVPRGPAPGTASVAPRSRDEKYAIARGAVELPAAERLSVLVSLSGDADPQIRNCAQKMLHGMSEEQCAELLMEPSLPESVARYFLDPAHVRPALLAVLLTRPNTPQEAVTSLVAKAGRDVLTVILDQLDLLKTQALLALKQNPAYLDWQKAPPVDGYVLEVDLLDMLIQEVEAGENAAREAAQPIEAEEQIEEGLYSKIAKMTVAKKVVLALRGNREERAILIRDGSKVVSRAVLSSPKLTDAEIESFATLKNVGQEVLRHISMNRKFMKNYVVMKNLVNNPRLPIDVGLTLLNRLMPQDLRFLSTNRDISETIRKMAIRSLHTRQH